MSHDHYINYAHETPITKFVSVARRPNTLRSVISLVTINWPNLHGSAYNYGANSSIFCMPYGATIHEQFAYLKQVAFMLTNKLGTK